MKNEVSNCFVYYAKVDKLDVENNVEDFPEIRLNKLAKLKSDEEKKLSAGVWLLLSKALEEHDKEIFDYEFKYQENGKPTLVNCSFEISLSHSGKYVMVALCDYYVGVDIQEMRPIDEKLIDYVLNDEEKEKVNKHLLKEHKIEEFYNIWALKESSVKMTGEGLTIKPKNIKICSNSCVFSKIKGYRAAVSTNVKCNYIFKECKL